MYRISETVEEDISDEKYPPLTLVTQSPGANLSLGSAELSFSDEVRDNRPNEEQNAVGEEEEEEEDQENAEVDDDSGSMNEIVIKVGEEVEEETPKGIIRQPSTTEYLSGMIHILSPPGMHLFIIFGIELNINRKQFH